VKKCLLGIAATLFTVATTSANAAVIISEVAPWSSGNSPVAADWFELTNTGASAVDITGWRIDDSSNSFGSAATLNGIGSIAAGQSVIFIESAGGIAISSFVSTWFGSNTTPLVGFYSGAGLGLGTGGDSVNIFNSAGVSQASISFGASDSISPFQTFDNAAGLTGAISQLSVVGTNGAFVAANNSFEIGSPGTIAAVPEPETYAMLLAGLGLMGFVSRKNQRKSS
jgi:hypothetical protein